MSGLQLGIAFRDEFLAETMVVKVTFVILRVAVPIAKNITAPACKAREPTFPGAAPASCAVPLYKNLARTERFHIVQSFQVCSFDFDSFFTLQLHAEPRHFRKALHNPAQAAIQVGSRFQAVNPDGRSYGEWTDVFLRRLHTGFLTRCRFAVLGKDTSPDALPMSLRLLGEALGAEVVSPCSSEKATPTGTRHSAFWRSVQFLLPGGCLRQQ